MYRHVFSGIAVVHEGKEPLLLCDLCGMYMPARLLIKQQRTQPYNSNIQMRWRRRDSAIASQCAEVSFSFTGEDEAECIDGMETLKYLGRMLDWSDDDWLEVLQNFGNARRVWSRLRKLLRREGADPRLSAMSYRAVVQVVLLIWADKWVLSAAISWDPDGVNMGFLRNVTGQKAKRQRDEAWRRKAE